MKRNYKKSLITIIMSFVSSIALYLIFAFAFFDMNPQRWTIDARGIFGLMSICFVSAIIILRYKNE